MFDRPEFIKKSEEILEFLDTYGVLRYEYLKKIFPWSDKVVHYLLKKQRIFKILGGDYISTDKNPRIDKCLIAALGVLVDLSTKVQSHARATAPAQISFTTHAGDYYEIVYVAQDMEAMVTTLFKKQDGADITKRIVIVEDKNQMERLQLPEVASFALVNPNGCLSYFKRS
jgi:hypothetical protein